uniref:Uncharacterized protein n=2 Tax=Lotharella oceanica TaxID=641309 RepID=A0A7S2U4C8_9EUKA|mmetsp:Transcript_797/g.1463  ORF Transcript_797/g.1463 Transcript_797/m.1463 type:complete len:176 (+) Transcript_797:741-1268(+)
MQSGATTASTTGNESLGSLCDQVNITKSLDCDKASSPFRDKPRVPVARLERSVVSPRTEQDGVAIAQSKDSVAQSKNLAAQSKNSVAQFKENAEITGVSHSSMSKPEIKLHATEDTRKAENKIQSGVETSSGTGENTEKDHDHPLDGRSVMKGTENDWEELPSEDDFLSDVDYDE